MGVKADVLPKGGRRTQQQLTQHSSTAVTLTHLICHQPVRPYMCCGAWHALLARKLFILGRYAVHGVEGKQSARGCYPLWLEAKLRGTLDNGAVHLCVCICVLLCVVALQTLMCTTSYWRGGRTWRKHAARSLCRYPHCECRALYAAGTWGEGSWDSVCFTTA